jgi:hypothetical protein
MNAAIYFGAENWGWVVVVFALGSVALLWRGYKHYPARGWPRWVAAGLKLAGLVLLALTLMEPMWSGDSPKKGANDFIVIADNSRRLAAKNNHGEAVGKELASLLKPLSSGGDPEILSSMAETFRLRTYLLDRVLRRVGDFGGLDFSSTGSGMVTALDRVLERFEGRPLAGVLVFTDGNVADGELMKDLESRGVKVPVFPVLVEGGESLGDLALAGVAVAQSAFEDAPVNITAEISAQGMEGQAVLVQVRDADDQVVAKEARRLGPQQKELIRLKIPSSQSGVSYYSVELSPAPGKEGAKTPAEATLDNNRRLVAVDRKRGPYRVLYVSGRPNWEYKFLRRSVAKDPEIELVGLVRAARREPKFEWRGRTGEMSNPLFRGFSGDVPEEAQRYDQPVLVRLDTKGPEELREGFPKTREALFGEYRAVILDDIEAGFFSQEQMNLLEGFVSVRGGSLLMLGGAESFREGNYDKTPIGGMLPVYLDRINAANPGGPVMEARLSLTREGWLEPWLRLRQKEDEEEARLAFMPEFHALNRVPAIKPGASLLAVATAADEGRHPALVTQRYGLGRCGAYLLGDVWRWGMKSPELRKDMEKSWRQLMRWLVVDSPDLIEFGFSRQSAGDGDGLDFSVKVRDRAFRANGEVGVKIEVFHGLGEGQKVAELFGEPDLEEEGSFKASFYPQQDGAYHAKVLVSENEGGKKSEREVGWARNSIADETVHLQPERATMERVAAASGGRVLAMDEVMAFVKEELPALETPIREHWARPLWHGPWVFLLALFLLAGEWGLRRWKGVI